VSVLAKILDTLADRTLVPGYSKFGYRLRRRSWEPLAADALRGKRALVTGANSGLGKATAAGLAELGATVHLVVRNVERGEAAREEIAKSFPEAELYVDQCDVSSMDSVRAFAAGFLAKHDAADILVHNAGRHRIAARFRETDGTVAAGREAGRRHDDLAGRIG